jgi:hypothetical protein
MRNGWDVARMEEIGTRDPSFGQGWRSVRHHFGITCDGEDVELGPGDLLYARPEVQRQAVALESPTLVFMVGGKPGVAYEVPDWDRE